MGWNHRPHAIDSSVVLRIPRTVRSPDTYVHPGLTDRVRALLRKRPGHMGPMRI